MTIFKNNDNQSIWKEVDFCIVKENSVDTLIECKYSDFKIDKNLKYFEEKYSLKGVQIVKELKNEYEKGNIKILNGSNFLKTLGDDIILR